MLEYRTRPAADDEFRGKQTDRRQPFSSAAMRNIAAAEEAKLEGTLSDRDPVGAACSRDLGRVAHRSLRSPLIVPLSTPSPQWSLKGAHDHVVRTSRFVIHSVSYLLSPDSCLPPHPSSSPHPPVPASPCPPPPPRPRICAICVICGPRLPRFLPHSPHIPRFNSRTRPPPRRPTHFTTKSPSHKESNAAPVPSCLGALVVHTFVPTSQHPKSAKSAQSVIRPRRRWADPRFGLLSSRRSGSSTFGFRASFVIPISTSVISRPLFG